MWRYRMSEREWAKVNKDGLGKTYAMAASVSVRYRAPRDQYDSRRTIKFPLRIAPKREWVSAS